MNFEMIEKRCLRASSRYSKVAGVWPGQDFLVKCVANGIVYGIVVLSTISQVSRIVVCWSTDILLEQLQFLCVPLGMYVKHSCFAMNQSKFKIMYDSILSDWQAKRTEDEEKIMESFADRAVLFIAIYIANAYFIGISFFCVPFVPYILDIVVPLNETRPRVHVYDGYYFVENPDDYYYEILVYTIFSLFVAVYTFMATDTLLIYLVQHSCALLRLSGHRIRFALEEWLPSREITAKDRKKMYDKVVYAIQTHERALAFLIALDNRFRMSLFLQMVLIVLTLTTTLLRAASVKLAVDTFQFYSYAAAQLVHIFFLTAQGQFIINEHEIVYRKGFQIAWHKADVKTQALLVLIQRRNLNPPLLTAGGVMQLDFDSFSEVVKASVSYFTVLKSV